VGPIPKLYIFQFFKEKEFLDKILYGTKFGSKLYILASGNIFEKTYPQMPMLAPTSNILFGLLILKISLKYKISFT
jgi:hypothetical protein